MFRKGKFVTFVAKSFIFIFLFFIPFLSFKENRGFLSAPAALASDRDPMGSGWKSYSGLPPFPESFETHFPFPESFETHFQHPPRVLSDWQKIPMLYCKNSASLYCDIKPTNLISFSTGLCHEQAYVEKIIRFRKSRKTDKLFSNVEKIKRFRKSRKTDKLFSNIKKN